MIDKIFFKESLKLVIYTIGYSIEGESLLILIKVDEVVIYTIVIDGYKVEDCNITHELLQKNKIEHIDMFCWSHPDRDHSIGIEDYIDFVDSNTTIIIGDGYYETIEKWERANKMMYELLEKELKKDLRVKDKIDIRKACMGMVLHEMQFTDVRTGIEHPLRIDAFAPSDFQNLRRNLLSMELLNNHISVGLRVTLGNKAAVFCADIPNVIFNSMREKDFPNVVDYIKIPHHGSRGSDKLLEKYSNKVEVACTTVNVANGLPNIDLLGRYRGRAKRIFCTNNLQCETQDDLGGVVKTVFYIDKDMDTSNDTYGNAREVDVRIY